MERPVMIGTGLSSPLGAALVAKMSSSWRIVALGRTPVDHAGVQWLPADFRRSREEWAAPLRAWLHEEQPTVTALVHAAGLVYSDRSEETRLDEWDSMLKVNLGAAFGLGQMVSPYFAPDARVVVVGSVDAHYASEAGPAAGYGAAKAGLYGLMRHWAAEWGPRGIRVNGVAPGALSGGMGPQSDAVEASLAARIALRRLGDPREVAAVLAFLLGPESSYMTGCWIPVDGGLNLQY